MNTPITKERWVQAQENEKTHHNHSFRESAMHYENAYKHYFSYVGGSFDLQNRSILEIGPAKVPGLYFCKNYSRSYIIEPLKFEETEENFKDKPDITFIRDPAETCDFPNVDEIWLFNVLQHVIDPNLIIERCKKHSKIIRYFEPIDTSCDIAHPHTFNIEFFENHFGKNCTTRYIAPPDVSGFHQHTCAYGVYHTT
jgi:hypothetical protein